MAKAELTGQQGPPQDAVPLLGTAPLGVIVSHKI